MVKRSALKETPSMIDLPLPIRYEEGIEELEQLIRSMESGSLPLDTLYQTYRRGTQLLNFCRDKLAVVENQIQVLENGQLTTWKDPT
jgi:exodeoxyribonuclease VII small subunit